MTPDDRRLGGRWLALLAGMAVATATPVAAAANGVPQPLPPDGRPAALADESGPRSDWPARSEGDLAVITSGSGDCSP